MRVLRVFNQKHDHLDASKAHTFRCPNCSDEFEMVGRRWVVKQCARCSLWFARGAYCVS
jgi:ribosomal protein L37AE/L43A